MKYNLVRLASPGEVPACCGKCVSDKTICHKYIKETIATDTFEPDGSSNVKQQFDWFIDEFMRKNVDNFVDDNYYTILNFQTGELAVSWVYCRNNRWMGCIEVKEYLNLIERFGTAVKPTKPIKR